MYMTKDSRELFVSIVVYSFKAEITKNIIIYENPIIWLQISQINLWISAILDLILNV